MGMPEQQLKFFSDYIQKHLGIIYTSHNYFQLEKRLEDICKILQIPSLEALYQQAVSGISGHLKQVLLDIATNNETSFFRDPKVFAAIEKLVFEDLAKSTPRRELCRVWCCASSFGQEPYSLVMMINEYAQRNPGMPRFEVLATDVSEQALARAKAAIYSQLEVQRGLGPQRLIKYFTKDAENNWSLMPEFRKQVRFSKLNLLEPFGSIGSVDMILCRHVLIYQTDEKKKEIISRLAAALNPRGYLILGGTESMIGLSNAFEQIACEGAILYRRKD